MGPRKALVESQSSSPKPTLVSMGGCITSAVTD
jgi:hypothetical protein